MVKINDISDNRIKHYKSLRFTPPAHTIDSVFITESEKVTLKLLLSKIDVVSIFLTEDYYLKFEDIISKKNIFEDKIFIAEKELMSQIVGYNLHNGIMAIGKKPRDIQPNKLKSPIIVLNGIIDAENIGTIVRNSVAFGIKSLIVDEKSSSPYLRRAVRVSMGNILGMEVYHSKNLIDTLTSLKSNGLSIYAAEISENSVNINQFKFSDNFALIFGNESHGVSPNILELCDTIIQIPINPSISSLNVASSSAIFFYEINNRINKFYI